MQKFQLTRLPCCHFENRSADAETEYLSDGLAESLIYRLSQLPNLKVSPTSVGLPLQGQTD